MSFRFPFGLEFKNIIFILLILCTCQNVSTQVRYKADSLLKGLEHSEGKDRIEILLHLSRAFIGEDKEKSLQYANESVVEAEKFGNDSFLIRSLNNVAVAYQNSGDYSRSIQSLDRCIELTRKNGNRAQLLESLNNKATAYGGMRQTDKALPFAQEALTIAEELKDSIGILNGSEIIAAAYKDLHKFDEAIKVYEQEMKILEYLPKRVFENGRANVNLGETYERLNQNEKAIELFKKGREYFRQFNYTVGVLLSSLVLADCYLKIGQLDSARYTYKEIIELNKSIQEPELNAMSSIGLGKIAMQKKQFTEAFDYFKQAESFAKNAGLRLALKELYSDMNDLFCLKGEYEKAKIYKQLSKTYADSLLNADVVDRLSQYQIQYETIQKEKEIAEQQLKINAQQSEIFKKNTWNYGLLASLIAFILLGWLFYNRFRLRKKAELDTAIISQQQLGLNAVIEAQESERRRIAKDLHDGIAQELVALKLGFTKFRTKAEKISSEDAVFLQQLETQLSDSCTEVRNISHTMMPPALENAGLISALETLIRNTFQHSNINANFDHSLLPEGIDKKTELGLYRIVQELLNNVIKHSNAQTFVLQLYTTNQNLIMRMEDDGIGFDFNKEKNKGSMGMLNILSRVSTLGGNFTAESSDPHGTISIIRIPL